jgi:hypothetical protein
MVARKMFPTFGICSQHSEFFMTIWSILCSFGTFFRFGIMYREKSGNPGLLLTELLLLLVLLCCVVDRVQDGRRRLRADLHGGSA